VFVRYEWLRRFEKECGNDASGDTGTTRRRAEQLAVAVIRAGIEALADDMEPETQEELAQLAGPLTPEDIASIGRGLADADAGRGQSGTEALNDLRRRLGLPVRE
jgi:hypothetical protein